MTIVTGTLDSFNRPDAPDLGPNWMPHAGFVAQRLEIVSNSARCPALAGTLTEFWKPQQFGPDVELTLDVAGTGLVTIYVRVPSPFPAIPDPDDWPDFDMLAEGGYSSNWMLGVGPAKSAVRLRAEGSTVTRYYKDPTTGGWVTDYSTTETAYPDAGYVMFALSDDALALSSTIGEGDGGSEPVLAHQIDIGHRLLR